MFADCALSFQLAFGVADADADDAAAAASADAAPHRLHDQRLRWRVCVSCGCGEAVSERIGVEMRTYTLSRSRSVFTVEREAESAETSIWPSFPARDEE